VQCPGVTMMLRHSCAPGGGGGHAMDRVGPGSRALGQQGWGGEGGAASSIGALAAAARAPPGSCAEVKEGPGVEHLGVHEQRQLRDQGVPVFGLFQHLADLAAAGRRTGCRQVVRGHQGRQGRPTRLQAAACLRAPVARSWPASRAGCRCTCAPLLCMVSTSCCRMRGISPRIFARLARGKSDLRATSFMAT
jgi:hypothetical protein